MEYGLLTTTSLNIGDEIQCLAAYRFLPQVDFLIHRERIDEFDLSGTPVSLIMSHWWLWSDKHFPPSDCIDPLYISFHMQYRLRNDKFMTNAVIQHFKKHEPIGCRDTGTAEYLCSLGIKAYFSGCITTTLLPNPLLKNKFYSDYILCVDVPQEVVAEIRKRTDREVLCIERHQKMCFSYEERLRMAKFTLFLYHNAHCVVTIALHAALPSTAFGTPVCVISQDNLDARSRFEGLESCFNILTKEQFLNDPESYDINNPPSNPDTFLEIGQKIAETCEKFTGFDSKKPVLEDDYNPIRDIAKIMPYRMGPIYKALYYVSNKDLLKTVYNRKVKGINRFAIEPSRKCDVSEVLNRKLDHECDN